MSTLSIPSSFEFPCSPRDTSSSTIRKSNAAGGGATIRMVLSPSRWSVDGSHNDHHAHIFMDNDSSSACSNLSKNELNSVASSSENTVLSSHVRGQLLANEILKQIDRSKAAAVTSLPPSRAGRKRWWRLQQLLRAKNTAPTTTVGTVHSGSITQNSSSESNIIGGTEEDYWNDMIEDGLQNRSRGHNVVDRLGLGQDGHDLLLLIHERSSDHEMASRYDMTTGLCWSHLRHNLWMPHYEEYVERHVQYFQQAHTAKS